MSSNTIVLLIIIVVSMLAGLGFLWANPLNWFIPTTSDFEMERFFEEVKVGSKVSKVIEEFGEPLLVESSSWEPWRLPRCNGCKVYHFAGPAPEWVSVLYMRYRGALVHADNDGIVQVVYMPTEN